MTSRRERLGYLKELRSNSGGDVLLAVSLICLGRRVVRRVFISYEAVRPVLENDLVDRKMSFVSVRRGRERSKRDDDRDYVEARLEANARLPRVKDPASRRYEVNTS